MFGLNEVARSVKNLSYVVSMILAYRVHVDI